MTNKVIDMTIAQIEKSSQEFKKTHKIKVSGPCDESQWPQWFKEWFKTYEAKTEQRFQNIENRLSRIEQKLDNEEMPKWFKNWYENEYQNTQPKWFEKWITDVFNPIIEKNNLKK